MIIDANLSFMMPKILQCFLTAERVDVRLGILLALSVERAMRTLAVVGLMPWFDPEDGLDETQEGFGAGHIESFLAILGS